ncbi:MAG: hypothetical protein Q7S54_00190 [bacterium]|nr:hypothetical protein [bacterium]
MITFSLFILSGTAIVTLTLAKRIEEKRKKGVFLLKFISRSDERAREFHQRSVRFYSVGKERTAFFIKKQLPMRSRNSLNKFISKLSEQGTKYLGDIRDSRLLKKPDGISEFFKNMSTIEKGAGEINEIYEERANESKEPAPIDTAPKPTRRPRTRKSPVRKKLTVVIEEE